MNLASLIEMSRKYGSSKDYVLAGGGNTSFKQDGIMAVKASGSALSDIDNSGFVMMDRVALLSMLSKQYPKNDNEREAAALQDMMKARLPKETKRPSVECILHALMPFSYVLHVHPPMINGLTCAKKGEEIFQSMLNSGCIENALWISLTKPGFILSKVCQDSMEKYKLKNGRPPQILMMQNHGIFVAADTTEEIDRLMASVMECIQKQITRFPKTELDDTILKSKTNTDTLYELYSKSEGSCAFKTGSNPEIRLMASSKDSMRPLMLPFTPDHIVYCKKSPLYLEENTSISEAFNDYVSKNGYAPKIAVFSNGEIAALGKNQKEADTAMELFLDAIKISVYTESFGGPCPLDDEYSDFILNWEVENYRQKTSLKA